MRTAELRMKEETAIAEKRGREEGDKNTVKVFKETGCNGIRRSGMNKS